MPPVALAGVVTGEFEFPPIADVAVNRAARLDYAAGIASLRKNSKLDAALASLSRAVLADPDSPLTHAALAEAQWFKYFATRDKSWFDRATESAREAEIRNPDLAPVYRIGGLLKARAGWYEQAEADYRRAIQLDPGNGDAYRRLGAAYQANNQFQDALAAYRRAIEAEPADYRNHQQLGAFYEHQSDYGEAAKAFRKAVELAPDEPELHRVLGGAYKSLGRFSEAESELRTSLRLAERPLSMHALGVILMCQRRDREAIQYIRRALSIGPERYLWWMNLSIACRRAD